MQLKQAFKKALEFEKKGHEIYEQIANKTENQLVEKTFRYLANQELFHIEEIKNYLKAKGKKIPHIKLSGDTLKDTQEFFTTTIGEFKKKTELSDDDLKAHETGLELEQRSYDFYKKQKEKAKDKELIKFFEFLMEQENAHYKFIQNTYEYIKNPIGFYTEEEKWIADGG